MLIVTPEVPYWPPGAPLTNADLAAYRAVNSRQFVEGGGLSASHVERLLQEIRRLRKEAGLFA